MKGLAFYTKELGDNVKKKLTVGVIGLGRISPRHIEDSIKQIKELKLAAVCDHKKELVDSVAKSEKVKGYIDYKKLIADKDVDVVAICTPNYLHLPMGLLAAKLGKHIIMEKPIAQNANDAKRLIKAFTTSKGILFPVLQVRYNPVIRVVKDAIDRNLLGKILTATLLIRWARPQVYFDESPWKGKKALDGGALLTQAIHYIDVMQYMLGKANSVFGKTATVGHNIEVEDITQSIIDFKSGTRAVVDFTICTYPKNIECSLMLLGEKGTIKIGGTAMNACEIWEVKDTPMPVIPPSLTPNQYASGMYVGSCPNHISIYQNAVDHLLHGKESFVNADDALESLRIIDAIKKSSALGREVVV